MRDFEKVDWKRYNRPPFYQQWMCKDDTLKLATFGDRGLAEFDCQILKLKDQWDLNNVNGHFLDRIGKFLSEKRNGNPDEVYRVMLHLRILLNTANGTVNDVIKVIKFFYASEVVNISPNYPAGITILHDGECPSVDFNRIIAAVVPAGVAYDTKELFYFDEAIGTVDELLIKILRKDTEYFVHPLKFNGTAKFDGETMNTKGFAKGKFNGVCMFNGDLFFNGAVKAVLPYQAKPPFKFSSGIVDKLSIDLPNKSLSDEANLNEEIFLGMRKHNYFDGANKFDGSIKFNSKLLIPLG
jgi:hypothetical protein